jgi:hypothetical protein
LNKPSDVASAVVAAIEGAGLVGGPDNVIGALAVHPAGFINVTVGAGCLFKHVDQLVRDGKAAPPKVLPQSFFYVYLFVS